MLSRDPQVRTSQKTGWMIGPCAATRCHGTRPRSARTRAVMAAGSRNESGDAVGWPPATHADAVNSAHAINQEPSIAPISTASPARAPGRWLAGEGIALVSLSAADETRRGPSGSFTPAEHPPRRGGADP